MFAETTYTMARILKAVLKGNLVVLKTTYVISYKFLQINTHSQYVKNLKTSSYVSPINLTFNDNFISTHRHYYGKYLAY